MDLNDYIRIIRQKGWLIILVAVLTAAAAFGFSKLQTPVYESSLRLLVQPARTDFGQAQAAKQLLRGYVQWIMHFSHPRLQSGRVIEVPGSSFLHFSDSDKGFLHGDYFDLGSVLYQHLPVLGGVVRSINRRLGS